MGTFAYYAVLTLLVTVAVLLILLILIQKGRGGGLSSSFGGGGGSSAFGAKTGDVLTWATSIIFGVFLLLAVALDLIVENQFSTIVPSTAGSVPALPVSTNNTPDTQTPTTMPTTPTTTGTAGAISDSINKNVVPAATQPVGVNGLQILKNAATQAAGAAGAATQPAGKLLNGLK